MVVAVKVHKDQQPHEIRVLFHLGIPKE